MITRREFVVALTGVAVSGKVGATPEAVEDAIKKIAGGAQLQRGRVKLDAPALIENGNSVVLSVHVDSPMTEADHVKAIHVFAPKNPLPNMISVHLTPRSGRAQFTTRVRVANTQTLMAVAQMSDGSIWLDRVDVVVTLAACLEELK